jgi:hypothetical protein
LHVDGRRPGEERGFQLSRPRYEASRQTVSYHVERLSKAARAAKVGSAAQASDTFGAASLSIVGAPAVVGNTFGGNDCTTTLENQTGWDVQAIGSSNWPNRQTRPAGERGGVREKWPWLFVERCGVLSPPLQRQWAWDP